MKKVMSYVFILALLSPLTFSEEENLKQKIEKCLKKIQQVKQKVDKKMAPPAFKCVPYDINRMHDPCYDLMSSVCYEKDGSLKEKFSKKKKKKRTEKIDYQALDFTAQNIFKKDGTSYDSFFEALIYRFKEHGLTLTKPLDKIDEDDREDFYDIDIDDLDGIVASIKEYGDCDSNISEIGRKVQYPYPNTPTNKKKILQKLEGFKSTQKKELQKFYLQNPFLAALALEQLCKKFDKVEDEVLDEDNKIYCADYQYSNLLDMWEKEKDNLITKLETKEYALDITFENKDITKSEYQKKKRQLRIKKKNIQNDFKRTKKDLKLLFKDRKNKYEENLKRQEKACFGKINIFHNKLTRIKTAYRNKEEQKKEIAKYLKEVAKQYDKFEKIIDDAYNYSFILENPTPLSDWQKAQRYFHRVTYNHPICVNLSDAIKASIAKSYEDFRDELEKSEPYIDYQINKHFSPPELKKKLEEDTKKIRNVMINFVQNHLSVQEGVDKKDIKKILDGESGKTTGLKKLFINNWFGPPIPKDKIFKRSKKYPFRILDEDKLEETEDPNLKRYQHLAMGEEFYSTVNASYSPQLQIGAKIEANEQITLYPGFIDLCKSNPWIYYSTLAHEMAHKFDPNISKYNGYKSLPKAYKKLIDCFKSVHSINLRKDQEGEIFADWVAGQILAQLIKTVPEDDRRDAILGAAEEWCHFRGLKGKKALTKEELDEEHPVLSLRCNATLGVNPEIRKMLGCKKNDGIIKNHCTLKGPYKVKNK